MMGKVHSIETMGLTDGPGIRFVVFFQGCELRCKYCHNPDTWKASGGEKMAAQELVQRAKRYQQYFNSSGGGITCSGGEPLLQPKFLIEFLKGCKDQGLHTAIDTSGYGIASYEEILKYTDLVILDIKHIHQKGFNELTGGNMEVFWDFVNVLNQSSTDLWIRHVVVPGVTDSKEHIYKLKEMLGHFKPIEKIQLLPYHSLGVHKYEAMGIPYPYHHISPMCPEELRRIKTDTEL
ncbi:pyruvate formate lyase activating enzyme [Desulfitispora alkaliphila]